MEWQIPSEWLKERECSPINIAGSIVGSGNINKKGSGLITTGGICHYEAMSLRLIIITFPCLEGHLRPFEDADQGRQQMCVP